MIAYRSLSRGVIPSSRITSTATHRFQNTQIVHKRLLSNESKETIQGKVKAKIDTKAETDKPTWWNSAELWGRLGAIAGWGMSGSAIYDSVTVVLKSFHSI
mmetsp:Transcript_14208/g.17257  ORF Transcript_14208/g.17257 Transcript_14208/m.17257 type:complete len:101 (-) Transcript_14208:748-1050(-)